MPPARPADRSASRRRGLLAAGRTNVAPLEIVMSEAETQTMRMLPDLCPDFRDLLGPYCSRTLDRGFKIELEAAMIDLDRRQLARDQSKKSPSSSRSGT